MTQNQYVIRRKLNILELGETLGNISEACRKLGVSRQHHYDIKSAIEEEGLEGLLEKSRKAPRFANRVSPEIEQKVLDYSLEFPTQGQKRVANELKKQGIQISDGGIRSIWLRHNLQIASLRLKRLEKWAAENESILTESQVQALEQAKEEKEAHGEIETPHPGFLLGQDTYYVGYIKGVGKIYQQTAIDTHSNVGFAKVYSDKTALVAADFLNNKVLPFFDAQNMALLRILTDRGTEYCGRTETHPYQLFLHLSGIEHSRTKVRHPQTNGSTERLNQTIQNEFYKVAFRKKLYKSIEEIQSDLDSFMQYYNNDRTNQGKHCQGRTPMQTFEDGRPLYQQYVFENSEEGKTAA
ncbi:MAG: IS481 family transposase [Nitrospinae bacterium]|nr:IS481 family transposase [Nitrospinota bacterium]MZH45977.1 IS481 family transposase [Nitrospinota bacterium]